MSVKADINVELDKKRDDKDLLVARGVLLTRVFEEYKLASQCFEEALVIDPDYADIWREQSVAFHYLEEYEDALKFSAHSIKLKPDDPGNWNIHGDNLQSLDHLGDALKAYRHVLAKSQTKK